MADIIDYIELFHNQKRRQYKLGCISQAEYEITEKCLKISLNLVDRYSFPLYFRKNISLSLYIIKTFSALSNIEV